MITDLGGKSESHSDSRTSKKQRLLIINQGNQCRTPVGSLETVTKKINPPKLLISWSPWKKDHNLEDKRMFESVRKRTVLETTVQPPTKRINVRTRYSGLWDCKQKKKETNSVSSMKRDPTRFHYTETVRRRRTGLYY